MIFNKIGDINRDGLWELYVAVKLSHSSKVFGPADTGEGQCFSREEICQCLGYNHTANAEKIAELLNSEAANVPG